ncbi:MAG: hypothetical protein O2993_02735 [Bacteroidetes bacterium]|nr:hypothetical protein [Bacteroidota bacterium]
MKARVIILLFITLLFATISTQSQCAMCRAVLESEEGKGTAEGINDGILYLMAIPYLVVGGLGFYIFRIYRRKR